MQNKKVWKQKVKNKKILCRAPKVSARQREPLPSAKIQR
jgi:hypothetical protein